MSERFAHIVGQFPLSPHLSEDVQAEPRGALLPALPPLCHSGLRFPAPAVLLSKLSPEPMLSGSLSDPLSL